MAMGKPIVLVGLDDSDESCYALDWTLQTFFTSPQKAAFKLIAVYAKRTAASAVGLTCPSGEYVNEKLGKLEQRIQDKAYEPCDAKSVNLYFKSEDGEDSRTVICNAVKEFNPSFLVVGRQGGLNRIVGSLSEYCVQHAMCSVMVVRVPGAEH